MGKKSVLQLQLQINRLQKMLLMKETVIQQEVIQQQKKLLETKSTTRGHLTFTCSIGHFGCKKDHARFDLVKVQKVNSHDITNEALNAF